MNRSEIEYAMKMLEEGFIPLVRERSDLERVLELEQEIFLKISTGRVVGLTKHVYDDPKSPVEYSALIVWNNSPLYSNEEAFGFDQLRNIEIVDYVKTSEDSSQLALFS